MLEAAIAHSRVLFPSMSVEEKPKDIPPALGLYALAMVTRDVVDLDLFKSVDGPVNAMTALLRHGALAKQVFHAWGALQCDINLMVSFTV